MTLSEFEIKRFEKIMDSYIERNRPPVHIRDELDLGYRIEKQSIEIFEIRPQWREPTKKMEHAVAKTTYVKRQGHWKIFWQRADLKWHSYEPVPVTDSLEKFVEVVEKDEYACFFG